MPKATIILTSYNHERFIGAAIDSVLHQTEQDFELIIWDDASKDRSWDIIQGYTDPRIKSFRNDRNMRGVYGINQAIFHHASSPYIAIHHSDDIWKNTKLKKQIDYLDAYPEIGAVFTKVKVVKEDLTPLTDKNNIHYSIFNSPNRTRTEWLKFFFFSNCLCHPSVLVRKSVYHEINGYPYGYGQLGDLYTWIQICLHHGLHIIQEELILFRILAASKNTSSASLSNLKCHSYEMYTLYQLFRKLAESNDVYEVFPEAKQYYHDSHDGRLFALAMVMLKHTSIAQAQLVGLDILKEMLQSCETAKFLMDTYNFGYIEYIAHKGKRDLFGGHSTMSLKYMEMIKSANEVLTKQFNEITFLRKILRDNNLLPDE